MNRSKMRLLNNPSIHSDVLSNQLAVSSSRLKLRHMRSASK